MASILSLLGKRVWWRSKWGDSDKLFSGVVLSVTTVTPEAHNVYAFVLSEGFDQPRPVNVKRLNTSACPYQLGRAACSTW